MHYTYVLQSEKCDNPAEILFHRQATDFTGFMAKIQLKTNGSITNKKVFVLI
jgi:hypothetical protein